MPWFSKKGGEREPAAAGGFYPGSKGSLKRMIEECFEHEFGYGKIPSVAKERKGELVGVVVPHAGYVYSGPIASHSFGSVYSDGIPESFVIFGPNHTGMGSMVATTREPWKMPFGTVAVDEMVRDMLGSIIDDNFEAHVREHSIEVQLPFLQYPGRGFRFVPVCLAMQDWKTAKEVGEVVADSALKNDRDIVLVASTDFTHAGMMYRDSPEEGMSPGEYAHKKDEPAVEKIRDFDPRGLIDTVDRDRITMCGPGGVAAMLVAAKKLGGKRVEFLKYATSADVKGEKGADMAVGYGAFAVYK